MALETRQAKLAHLLRRAAFAATPALLLRYQDAALPEVIHELLQGLDAAEPDGPEQPLPLRAGKSLDLTTLPGAQMWWLHRMATTKHPLRERMTLHWHGHFTSAISKVRFANLLVDQNAVLRRRALGSFEALLKEIAIDPAMLIWLDGRSSKKGSPNENYAREVMELFALGIGHYTEDDVKNGARALTGYTVTKEGVTAYRDGLHDHGTKSYLGTTGDLGYNDIARVLAKDPDTATYIAGRLWSAFAYPSPDPADVAPLVRAYQESDGDISAVLRALFTSDAFYSPRAVGALVRTPVELAVAACRMTGVSPVDPLLLQSLKAMGQELFNPPNVAGWPPGMVWLGSGGLVARMSFGRWVATKVVQADPGSMNPREVLDELSALPPDGLLGYWARRLDLEGRLTANTYRALDDYRAIPDTMTDLMRQTLALVQALMACPEAHIL